MRLVWASIALVLLAGHGLGLPSPAPAPAPADRASGWPDLWGVLRTIRDTSASSTTPPTPTSQTKAKTKSGNVTPLDTKTNKADASVDSDLATKQASNKVADMWLAMRGGWQDALDKVAGKPATTKAPAADLESRLFPDVADKQLAGVPEQQTRPQQTTSEKTTQQQTTSERATQPKTTSEEQTSQQTPQQTSTTTSFVSSALERVLGTARSFGEMGRAVTSTVGRWGKAMADSVAGTVSSVGSTVNTAVGTVLQVMKGGKQDDDRDHVCFSDLGCFSLREPWISSKRPLPRMNPPEMIQTKFYLHTRNSTGDPELLDTSGGEDALANGTALILGAKTFFLVHGFNDKCTAAWVQDMKDALLAKVDCNVILVDWSLGAQASKNYLQAASNTRVVGAELARVVEFLVKPSLVRMDMVHAIGHSLGAHVAGYAGKQLGGKLGRITALDAAQPAFEDQDAEVRVAAGDALFVDVVHTNGAPFIPTLGLGVMHPVGDVDFYLNGGTVQPGCFVPKLPAVNSLSDLAVLPVSVLGDMLSCSHRRAIEYFTEAIRSDCTMWGKRRVEDDLAADRGGAAAVESVGDPSSPWWHPLPSPGFGGLLTGVFSGDARTTTETPVVSTTSRGFPFNLLANVFAGGEARSPTTTTTTTTTESPASSRTFSFPFLTNMFSSGGRKRSVAKRRPTRTKLIVKNQDVEVDAVESNDIADTPDLTTATPVIAEGPLLAPAPAWCDDDCLPLGLDTQNYGLKGTFNVDTADHAPYCIHEELKQS